MIETTRGLVVEQPIEVVTAYLADFANAQDWHPAIHDCTRLDIGHLQVGAQWRGRLSLLYWNGELDYTLTRRRPHWITLNGGGRHLTTSADFARTDLPGKTACWFRRLAGDRCLLGMGFRIDDLHGAASSAWSEHGDVEGDDDQCATDDDKHCPSPGFC